jgi:hypothetical protein
MSMDAAHWLLRAEEARTMARLCDDPVLRSLMEEVAQNYDALAASRYPDARQLPETAVNQSARRV